MSLFVLLKLFKGSKDKDLLKYGGLQTRVRTAGKDLSKDLLDRVLQTMMARHFLDEDMVPNYLSISMQQRAETVF